MAPSGVSQQHLLAIPLSSEWDDVQGQWFRPIEPAQHTQQIFQAAQRMRDECQAHQRSAIMGLGLHPWVWGMPSRIKYLRELLAQLNQLEGVVLSTPQQIYQQCTGSAPD
jgi:hypothetical protein